MYVEQDCTIEHEGKTFEAGGAVVTDEYAIGYVKIGDYLHLSHVDRNGRVTGDPLGTVTDWRGNYLGNVYSCQSFRLHPSSFGSQGRMFQIKAQINGIWYTGRTQGNGMIWRGKRCAKQ